MNSKKRNFLLTLGFALTTTPFFAPNGYGEVIFDGTVGQAVNLNNILSEYKITSDLGTQVGGNLLHSFQAFNLSLEEYATFSGPDSIENIISRVTGGTASNIDGLLRSTIPEANLYFLNPAGVIFGPHAALDIQGSFHVSTADYLKLSDGSSIDVSNQAETVLTSAQPAAFGFLSDNPASISFQGSGSLLSEADLVQEGLFGNGMGVKQGKTISIIGGDISVGEGTHRWGYTVESSIKAPGGRINVASLSGPGTVTPTIAGLQVDTKAPLGTFSITGQSNVDNFLASSAIDTSGPTAGQIYIRGGKLVIDNGSRLESSTTDAGKDGGIDIKLSGNLILDNESALRTDNRGTGGGPNLEIKTDNLSIANGAFVSVRTYNAGSAGDTTVAINGDLTISGWGPSGYTSGILTGSKAAANGGEVNITAKNITLAEYGSIFSQSAEGNGADVAITSKTLTIKDGGAIDVSVSGSGEGGGFEYQCS